MEHLSGSTGKRASRATESLNNASDINRSLRRSQSVDAHPHITESSRNELNDLRFLYRSQSSDQPGSRPTQSEYGEDIIRSLYQSQSSYGSASSSVQPGRRLSHRRSFEGTFPLEASRQSPDSRPSFNIIKELYGKQPPERTPIPESKQLEVHTSSEPSTLPSIVAESSGIQPILFTEPSSFQPLPGEHSSHPPRSTEIWTPSTGDAIQSRDNPASSFRGYPMDGRESNQPTNQDAWIRAFGITEYNNTIGEADLKEYISIIRYAAENSTGETELLGFLSEKSAQISQERDQVYKQDVETLLKALDIRDDDLSSGNYLEARKYAQRIVRVIRTDGPDKEFNDAKKELLKLAPERSWQRSLVNPRKDTIDWYEATWRNEQAMSKLDPTSRVVRYIRQPFYQANGWVTGPINTRSGNLAFIGSLAAASTAYTSYMEGKFAWATFAASIDYAASARFFYSMLPTPMNQVIDILKFQGEAIGFRALQRFITGS
jgi:hypothetical protein